jgi:hypothetical protein
MSFAATPPSTFGTLAKYYALPAHLVHALPKNVDDEDGAMMEPLSVAVHSVKGLGQCSTNETVLVFGAGPIGLLCMAVAKALGARRVIAVDIMQEKLDFARNYAATDTFLPVSHRLYLSDGSLPNERTRALKRMRLEPRCCLKRRSIYPTTETERLVSPLKLQVRRRVYSWVAWHWDQRECTQAHLP